MTARPATARPSSHGTGVGTITDDDAQPSISIDDVTLIEGDSGDSGFEFSVDLSNASSQAVTVDFATADDTATAPGDYDSDSGTVTFAPGEDTQPVTVNVNGDTTDESDETFDVDLTNNSANSSIADNQGVGTIIDDDDPVPPVLPGPPTGGADTDPPNTTITSGPKAKTKKKKTTLGFNSSESGSTFQCKLDGGSFQPCTSPQNFKVKKSTHTFQVRATDAAGNTDPTPASQSWKVKKKKKK